MLDIVTGDETDTFSRAPAPVELRVDSVDSSGNKSTLATLHLPATTIDLGSRDQSTVATLQVTGTDSDNNRVVYGQSIPLQFGALDGLTVPIFVQRTGELAGMPGPLSDARPEPELAVFAGRYLFVGGGSDATLATATQLYDFAAFAPLVAPPLLPRVPRSVAFVGVVALLIDDAGASSFDFSQNTSSDATAPAGGSFGDVAGGATVFASDGSQYVVGATRTTGAPTSAVLAFDANGTPSWASLTEPRLGAAATWVQGRGLVVAGGSASGAGVEIVGPGAAMGYTLDYPADASTASGAATLDSGHVLLAGGTTLAGDSAGVRAIDLMCAQCAPTPWGALPVTLSPAQVFASDASDALIVGDDSAGTTHVFRATPTGPAQEVGTRVPHTGARAIVSPVGSVVLFGGASEIESFVP